MSRLSDVNDLSENFEPSSGTLVLPQHHFEALLRMVLDEIAARKTLAWAEEVTKQRGGYPPSDGEVDSQNSSFWMFARDDFEALAARIAEGRA